MTYICCIFCFMTHMMNTETMKTEAFVQNFEVDFRPD